MSATGFTEPLQQDMGLGIEKNNERLAGLEDLLKRGGFSLALGADGSRVDANGNAFEPIIIRVLQHLSGEICH